MTDPLLVRAARGERTERPPVWLMRQAGRHLPEYRDLREQYSFREAIETPEVAEEITLQPYERYGVDGVVMFSDILTCLEPLGFDYHIESGVGPVIENPVEGPDDVARRRGDVREELSFVADLLDRLAESVADEDAVLGFAGGPFTLASYVVAGGPDRGRKAVRKFRARHPDAFRELMARFADVVAEYLQMQADHGADAVQLFDTYAGVLPPPTTRSTYCRSTARSWKASTSRRWSSSGTWGAPRESRRHRRRRDRTRLDRRHGDRADGTWRAARPGQPRPVVVVRRPRHRPRADRGDHRGGGAGGTHPQPGPRRQPRHADRGCRGVRRDGEKLGVGVSRTDAPATR
nr:uroporphyrinogen decarboxylase family protein [Halolamina pelagica]